MALNPKRARKAIFAGLGLSALGVFVAASLSPTIGGYATLTGWALLAWSLHSFGRVGASS